ncbi:T9SS type A sorting domain-containing protein [Flavobacterium sp. CYK-55]|uniref:T9SS type A sorting domain-containing protein n=1 Tax=Flavobacterium sp. CYK-55 TaxID=2835529 RepID=UPI001BCFABBC|nr:T9SS type A sorting domain-containing protein [Flavobacterium sp. CYK-55]MBS7787305.1 T9SS type A sorting domain-containing protein [Flavobacterium sp. CYK-55]
MKNLFYLAFILETLCANAQFIGHSGVYYLGSSDVPIPQTVYNNPNISGVVCRFRWENLEIAPNEFDWTYIDNEVLKATNSNKKICLQPLASPAWIYNSLGALSYSYVDNNPYHSTYGQVLTDNVPFDNIYINRVKNLLLWLSIKYANNPTVSYINAVGGQISRGLPEDIITDTPSMSTAPFWSTFNYDADIVASKINLVIDYYMSLFPNTPLWCSVDYVTFEPNASNRPRNYLASQYTDYGVSNFPDRFGLWREDISGCTTTNPNSSSHWSIMLNNPCRTGAQMLWNVQDGPLRMNQCGISPNTKQAVFDEAINKALFYNMNYVEVYGADVQDPSLSTNIINANNLLNNQSITCSLYTNSFLFNNKFTISPNPASETIQINFNEVNYTAIDAYIYNILGQKVIYKKVVGNEPIDISYLNNGVYIIQIKSKNEIGTQKIAIYSQK